MKIWQAARPARAAHRWPPGRNALVHGADGQRARPRRSENQRVRNIRSRRHSGPHGLVEDKDGNIWYPGNTGALIGSSIRRRARNRYPMPDPQAKDPHTFIFEKAGILWFTVRCQPHRRLDPTSGEISCSRRSRNPPRHGSIQGEIVLVQLASTRWRESIRRRWKSASTPCRIGFPSAPLAITSDDMIWSPTIRAGTWAFDPRPEGGRMAVSGAAPIRALRISGSTSHLVQRVRAKPNTVVASIPRRRSSRAGRFPAGATSSQHGRHEDGTSACQQPGQHRDLVPSPSRTSSSIASTTAAHGARRPDGSECRSPEAGSG